MEAVDPLPKTPSTASTADTPPFLDTRSSYALVSGIHEKRLLWTARHAGCSHTEQERLAPPWTEAIQSTASDQISYWNAGTCVAPLGLPIPASRERRRALPHLVAEGNYSHGVPRSGHFTSKKLQGLLQSLDPVARHRATCVYHRRQPQR